MRPDIRVTMVAPRPVDLDSLRAALSREATFVVYNVTSRLTYDDAFVVNITTRVELPAYYPTLEMPTMTVIECGDYLSGDDLTNLNEQLALFIEVHVVTHRFVLDSILWIESHIQLLLGQREQVNELNEKSYFNALFTARRSLFGRSL